MKHTPGPWKICDDGINVYAEPDIAITNQDHPCAPDQDEAEANALLIAAAPSLLEILKCYRDSHNPCIEGSPQGLCNKCRIAEKVIESAEGGGK